MECLDLSLAWRIALLLLDERDQAALRCTNRFWRDVYCDPGLWSALSAERFGEAQSHDPADGNDAEAQGGVDGGGAGGAEAGGGAGAAGAGAGAPSEQRWRQLVMTAGQQPVACLDRIAWLDGLHLRRAIDATSTFPIVIHVQNVWWLELCGTFHGVLPGTYHLAWRMRMEPYFSFQSVRLIARQQGVDEDVGPAGIQMVDTAVSSNAISSKARQARGRWFVLKSQPFEVTQLCSIWAELNGINTSHKHGFVLDSVSLVRSPAHAWVQPAVLPGTPSGGVGAAVSRFFRKLWRGLKG